MKLIIEKLDNGFTMQYYETVAGYGPLCKNMVFIDNHSLMDYIKKIIIPKGVDTQPTV